MNILRNNFTFSLQTALDVTFHICKVFVKNSLVNTSECQCYRCKVRIYIELNFFNPYSLQFDS